MLPAGRQRTEAPETSGVPHAAFLFASLRGFRLSWLKADFVAALTLAAIAIPEQLATARLIGFPPFAGFLAFAAGSLGFALFGASRYVSVGANSTVAPVVVGGLATLAVVGSPQYVDLAVILALGVGVTLVISQLLRLGWIADLVSVPVTTGFLAGIAVHIMVGQSPTILGLAPTTGPIVDQVKAVIRALPQANLYSTSIGAAVVVAGIMSGRFSKRIPGPLIVVCLGGLAVWAFDLSTEGVQVFAPLHWSLPTAGFVVPDWRVLTHLAGLTFIVALLCIMQTASVVQSYPSRPSWQTDVGREFGAVGAGNLLAALFGAFPVNASPPRTAVAVESQTRSQLAALLAAILVLILAAVSGGAFAFLPKAALGGMLVFVAIRMVRLPLMMQIYRRSPAEMLLAASSAALVIFLPVEIGVAMSIALSVLQSVYSTARPACGELLRVRGTTVWWSFADGEAGEREPGVLVYSFGGPLNFINSNHMVSQLMQAIMLQHGRCGLVVIEATGVIEVDFTGSEMMAQTIRNLRQQGTEVCFARLESDRARSAASRSGLLEVIGKGHIFRSVEDAVQAFKTGPDGREATPASGGASSEPD